jgi:hypothetical protein
VCLLRFQYLLSLLLFIIIIIYHYCYLSVLLFIIIINLFYFVYSRLERQLQRERPASQVVAEGAHLRQQVHGADRDERGRIFREVEEPQHVSPRADPIAGSQSKLLLS